MTESVLDQYRRHVAEGAARIERQEALAAEMERDDHPQAHARALELLETLKESHRLAIEHLERELAKN